MIREVQGSGAITAYACGRTAADADVVAFEYIHRHPEAVIQGYGKHDGEFFVKLRRGTG